MGLSASLAAGGQLVSSCLSTRGQVLLLASSQWRVQSSKSTTLDCTAFTDQLQSALGEKRWRARNHEDPEADSRGSLKKASRFLDPQRAESDIWSHHLMASRWGKMETVTDFIFLGSKTTADSDCSHKIKRHLLLGRRAMTNLDSIVKSRDITLLTKV